MIRRARVVVSIAVLMPLAGGFAQNVQKETLSAPRGIAGPIASATPPPYRLAPAGPKPRILSPDCSQLSGATEATPGPFARDDDSIFVDQLLKKMSPDHGRVLYLRAPQEFMWWVRMIGTITIHSLGTAIHEVNHEVDSALTSCHGVRATYVLKGNMIITEHRAGDTPNYSILSEMLPNALKNNQVGSRYPQYIERNGSSNGADFSVLLDEFVAYVGAAAFELEIVRSKEYSWLLRPEVTSQDINTGGVADFMIYTLSYLKTIRLRHPDAYRRLKHQPKTIALLARVWSTAEDTLVASYDHTQQAGRGGRLIVSREAISFAYSEEFLNELDQLRIVHLSASAWDSTYLQIDK